jgi:DNA mismatch repair protein MutL
MSQAHLFPQEMELEKADLELVMDKRENLGKLGLDIEKTGEHTIAVKGMPAELKSIQASELIEQFIENYHETELANETSLQEKLALALAKAGAIRYGRPLEQEEMNEVTDQLFACRMPNFTPEGKATLTIIKSHELEARLR